MLKADPHQNGTTYHARTDGAGPTVSCGPAPVYLAIVQRLTVMEHLYLVRASRHAYRFAAQIGVDTWQFADHRVVIANLVEI